MRALDPLRGHVPRHGHVQRSGTVLGARESKHLLGCLLTNARVRPGGRLLLAPGDAAVAGDMVDQVRQPVEQRGGRVRGVEQPFGLGAQGLGAQGLGPVVQQRLEQRIPTREMTEQRARLIGGGSEGTLGPRPGDDRRPQVERCRQDPVAEGAPPSGVLIGCVPRDTGGDRRRREAPRWKPASVEAGLGGGGAAARAGRLAPPAAGLAGPSRQARSSCPKRGEWTPPRAAIGRDHADTPRPAVHRHLHG